MADTEDREGTTLPLKRKPDLPLCEAEEDRSSKNLKPEPLDGINHNNSNHSVSEDKNGQEEGNHSETTLILEEKRADYVQDDEEEEDDEDYDENDDDEEEEEEDEEDDEGYESEDYKGKTMVDLKGKGVMKDDKGKGKLIVEEEEDDDSDDTSVDDYGGNVGVQSESESDLSDDPLAEVDLDNILPSRTRRRTSRSGVFIPSDRNDGGNADRRD